MRQQLVFLFTIELSSGQEPFACLPVGHTQMISGMQEIKFQSDSDVVLTDILECIKYLGINHFDGFFSDEQRDSSINLLEHSESKHPGRSSCLIKSFLNSRCVSARLNAIVVP